MTRVAHPDKSRKNRPNLSGYATSGPGHRAPGGLRSAAAPSLNASK